MYITLYYFSLLHPSINLYLYKMTRGNQRELARERNLKKQQHQKKSQPHQDGVKLDNRMERDADIMRKKQEAAAAKKAAEEAAARAEKNKKLQVFDPLK
uniref:4F5 domain-containing protein n=1 Tax=Onchocerca volvulus TaxID=6282 RepID=A0A8R1TPJ1_ONCVO